MMFIDRLLDTQCINNYKYLDTQSILFKSIIASKTWIQNNFIDTGHLLINQILTSSIAPMSLILVFRDMDPKSP